jgi:hypothetical protein
VNRCASTHGAVLAPWPLGQPRREVLGCGADLAADVVDVAGDGVHTDLLQRLLNGRNQRRPPWVATRRPRLMSTGEGSVRS